MTSIELLNTNRKISLLENLLENELKKETISIRKLARYEKELTSILLNLKTYTLIEAKKRFTLVKI